MEAALSRREAAKARAPFKPPRHQFIQQPDDQQKTAPGRGHASGRRRGKSVRLFFRILTRCPVDILVRNDKVRRPKSVKFYRTVRSLLSKRPIDVGYDVVDPDFKVEWDEANKALGVAE